LGKYKGEWIVCIGFKGEHLKEIDPIVETLKAQYPEQNYYIANSKFSQYTFILICRANTRDDAHKIGLALVKKHLPSHLNLLYWVKEKKLLDTVAHPPISTVTNQKA